MTRLGKLLVLLNLMLSMVFVAWAIGLATNQVPWHTPPAGEGPKVTGLVAEQQDKLKQLLAQRDSVDARWADAYLDLQGLEKQRPERMRYYLEQIRSVRQGGVPGIEPPVQKLELGAGNAVVLKKTGRPAIQLEGKDALSLAGYHAKIQSTIKEIHEAEEAVKKLVAEEEALTRQITGTKPRADAITAEEKGLHVQLIETEDEIRNLDLEKRFLQSPLTYYLMQLNQLRKRQADLTLRLDELKGNKTLLGRGT